MDPEFKHPQARLIGTIALIIMPLMGATIDVYTPSLPAIHTFFNCSMRSTQLTITAYIISYGIFQLLFGTLSDISGRKKMLLFGGALFTIASALATLSSSILILIFFRALQGVAAGAIGSACRALIPDSFSGKSYHKMINYLTLAWGCGPIIAPAIGGYLQHYFGWHASLWFLSGYGLLVLALAIILPETLAAENRSTFGQISSHYQMILSNIKFAAYVLLIMLVYGTMTMFNVIGPFLIQVVLKQSPIVYGHISLLIGVAWVSGNIFNRFTLHWNTNRKIVATLAINITLSLLVLFFFHIYPLTPVNLTVIIFLISLLSGLILPNGYSMSLEIFPQAAGAASAIMGSLFITGAGVATVVATFLKTSSAIPLLYAYITMFALSLIIIIIATRQSAS